MNLYLKNLIVMALLAACGAQPLLSVRSDHDFQKKYLTPGNTLLTQALAELPAATEGETDPYKALKASLRKAISHSYSDGRPTAATAAVDPVFKSLAELPQSEIEDDRTARAMTLIQDGLRKKYIAPDALEFAAGTPLKKLQDGHNIHDMTEEISGRISTAPISSPAAPTSTSIVNPFRGKQIQSAGWWERKLSTVTRGLAGRDPLKAARKLLAAAPSGPLKDANDAFVDATKSSFKQRWFTGTDRSKARLRFASLTLREDKLKRHEQPLADEVAKLNGHIETLKTSYNQSDSKIHKSAIATIGDKLHKKREKLLAQQKIVAEKLHEKTAEHKFQKAMRSRS